MGEESRETSEERTYNGAERAVSEESSVTPNGDCVPEEKRDLENVKVKESDLKVESLPHGKIKEEVIENGKLKDHDEKLVDPGTKVKVEIKEEVDIKEENCDYFENEKGQIRIKDETSILGLESHIDEDHIKKEMDMETKGGKDKTKDKSPSPPKELLPIYDSSPYLPDTNMFELVVTSVEQLRALIQKFGDLPEGAGSGSNSSSSTGSGPAGDEEKNSPKKAKVSALIKH